LCLRLAGCGTWPIWGHFHEPSARTARTAMRAASPFGAVTRAVPPGAFDPMGNLVTAAWVHGDLASCQSPSCDERRSRNPWVATVLPKRVGVIRGRLPKTAGQVLPSLGARRLQYCSIRHSGFLSTIGPSVRKGTRPWNSARLGASQTIRSPLLPTFWASEEYQKWRQEKGSKTSPASQHSGSCLRCLSHSRSRIINRQRSNESRVL
jgi:hypothetical protein